MVGGAALLTAVAGAVFVVFRRRQAAPGVVLLPEVTDELDVGLSLQDDASVVDDIFSSYQSVIDAEPIAELPIDSPSAPDVVPSQIEGIEIQPLEPAMHSPLASIVESTVVAPQPIVEPIVPEVSAMPVVESAVCRAARSPASSCSRNTGCAASSKSITKYR
jgi:hypothetical protein